MNPRKSAGVHSVAHYSLVRKLLPSRQVAAAFAVAEDSRLALPLGLPSALFRLLSLQLVSADRDTDRLIVDFFNV